MKLFDQNKPRRDKERWFLQRRGWKAFWAFKQDGSIAKKWIWLHPNYRKPCSRQEAIKITKLKNLENV